MNLSPRLNRGTVETAPNRDTTGRYAPSRTRYRPARRAGTSYRPWRRPQPDHSRTAAKTTAALTAVLALTVLAGCGSTGVVTAGPGESLNAAAKRAGRDGIVKLQAGTYPAQTVNTGTTGDCYTERATAQTRDCRTFLVPQGVKVHLGNLRVEGSGTALLATRGDLTIDGLYTLSGASETVVRGAVIDPASGDPGVYLDHPTNFALIDSEIKGVVNADGIDNYGGPTGARNTLIEGSWIHDVRITGDSCAHVDGIQDAATTGPGNVGTVIRNNTIEDTDQNASVQLDTANGSQVRDGVVEGNTLGPVRYAPTSCIPDPYPRAMNISGMNLTVRGNVFVGNKAFVYPGTGMITGNRGPGTSGACSAYAWSGNQWTEGGC